MQKIRAKQAGFSEIGCVVQGGSRKYVPEHNFEIF